ncbi:hypothetical protein F5Y16DRAFT_334410 [Xylariaceae sp. FL0255]|nr:hypothetical protein F5Y16DRAFT_334410 [Xylariaceae sp. FL0255]
MAEEPTLPSLPKVSWDSQTQTFKNTRKRNRDGMPAPPVFSNSSDPAVFSSDDDPNVENYANGSRHKKKRYYGSWFQQQPAPSDSAFGDDRGPLPKLKRTFERQVDSGVWMGSDGSIDLDDEFGAEIEVPHKPKFPQLRQTVIGQKIEDAIEQGNPNIDLSSLDISSLPNEIIARLSDLCLIPSVDKDVPFEQKDPELGIYLGNNCLTRAPGALFRLQHLTYLSLRNNQISELPASLGELHNLRELNVSLNRLRYLPGELLDLLEYPSHLQTLNIHPNPFYRLEGMLPSAAELGLRSGETVPSSGSYWLQWQTAILARSPVQYSNSHGIVRSKFRLPDEDLNGELSPVSVQPEDLVVNSNQNTDTPGNKASRVPSLFELAAQSCARAAQTWDLVPYLPTPTPSSLVKCIEKVSEQSYRNGNSGTVPCSICERHVIQPMTQWIEWWDISQCFVERIVPLSKDPSENGVPFLKRGCSWACTPKAMKAGQLAPEFSRVESSS